MKSIWKQYTHRKLEMCGSSWCEEQKAHRVLLQEQYMSYMSRDAKQVGYHHSALSFKF